MVFRRCNLLLSKYLEEMPADSQITANWLPENEKSFFIKVLEKISCLHMMGRKSVCQLCPGKYLLTGNLYAQLQCKFARTTIW